MTTPQVAAILALDEKRTQGEWVALKHGLGSWAWRVTLSPDDAHGDIANVLAGLAARQNETVGHNAAFIAAAPTMVSIIREQQAELEALREAAAEALFEMRHTVAPRHSFTDAVDRLDAALTQQTQGHEP